MNIRRVAAVIVTNKDGKILIMKRSSKKKTDPNKWGLPAGGVIGRESLEQTAIRETFEETGLKIRNLKKGPMIQVKVPGGVHQLNYFLSSTDVIEVKLNPEHSGYKWVKPVEALNYEFGVPIGDVSMVLQKFGLL
jgi:8-oxo-dGTP diphosphatase